jgi:hypothetical protein
MEGSDGNAQWRCPMGPKAMLQMGELDRSVVLNSVLRLPR